jgi:uncharacterized protein (DUF433 family)
MGYDSNKRVEDVLRVTLQGTEVLSLMARYPKLTRTEITDVVTRSGPMRSDVEQELTRLSDFKR